MSCTVETEHGRFEADDLKTATAMARKAKREAAQAEAKRRADYALAHQRAFFAGYRVHELARRLDGPVSAFALTGPRKPGDNDGAWSCRILRDELSISSYPRQDVQYETENGRALYEHIGYRVVLVLDGCQGVMAVVTEDTCTGARTLLAVGVENGVIAMVECNCLDDLLAAFAKRGEARAA